MCSSAKSARPAIRATASCGCAPPRPVHKALEGFDLSASTLPRDTFEYLSSLEWISQHRNVASVGSPGTGKMVCGNWSART